jgi:hypothetical protein
MVGASAPSVHDRNIGGAYAWLSFDLLRLTAAAGLMVGRFFIEREVVTLPVSVADIRRSRWLLGTVGMTILSASARAVSSAMFVRTPTVGEFVWFTVVEFVSAGACVACERFFFRAVDQPARRAEALSWLAALTFGATIWWCNFARIYGPGDRPEVAIWFALSAAGFASVTALGFRFVPDAHTARVPQGALARVEGAPAGAFYRPRVITPLDGVIRWTCREMMWAIGFGSGGVLLIASLEMWVPVGDRRFTILEALSGTFRSGRPFGVAFYAVMPLAWLTRLTPNLRLFRSVPVALWTLVSVVTAGPVLAWTSVWCLQAGAYRWSVGAWPSSPPFSMFFFVLSLTAGAKTMLLCLGSRYSIAVLVVWLNLVIFGLPTSWTTNAMAIVPAAASSISLVLLLMFADHMILTRTSRLYRPSTSVV